MFDCPTCGANLKFDITLQDLGCTHCGNHYDVHAFDEKKANAEEDTGEYDVTIFTCPQCGGELVSADNEAAVFCSYCGASHVLESRIGKKKRPKYIIPFKVTKEECKKKFLSSVKSTGFAPKELLKDSIVDSFRGIYMPYWVYNVTQQGKVKLAGEQTSREGDYLVHKNYAINLDIDANYGGFAKDSASSFDDDISESLAPYDPKDAVEFTPAYMSGFYADTADVMSKVYEDDAKSFAFRESMKKIERNREVEKGHFIGGDHYTPNSLHTKIDHVESAMYPVWFLSYRNGDRIAYAAVNGQTGKVMADVPISKTKYMITSLLAAIPLFFLLNLFFTFTPGRAMLVTLVLHLISFIVHFSFYSSISDKETKKNDRGWMAKQQEDEKKANSKKSQEKKKGKKIGKKMNKDSFKPIDYVEIACFILGIAVWFWSPVSDLWYYGVICVICVSILVMLIQMIQDYNLISTRKLPQFNRTGGDDDVD